MSTLSERLDVLGFKEYSDYLHSEHWLTFRKRYACDKEQRHYCLVCKDRDYILHHLTYERLGEEFITDVMPLCDDCHHALHQKMKERKRWAETVADVLRLFGRRSSKKMISSEHLENIRSIINQMSKKELRILKKWIAWRLKYRGEFEATENQLK